MQAIDVSRFDLNLLVVLDALLESSSVSGAACRLGLTQPTVSHSLGRLREALGDPILVRTGRGMVRTPRAEAVAPSVRRLLHDAANVFVRAPDFDPAQSTRSFSIACPDLLVALLPQLLSRLSREAPLVRLEARLPPANTADRLADGALDLAIVPARSEGAGLVQKTLRTVHFSVLARRGHPSIRKAKLDKSTWLAHPHVIVGTAGGTGLVTQMLERSGDRRRIAFVAPSFMSALYAAASTDWFFAAPRELVTDLARELDLVLLDPPMPLPGIRVATLFHERMQADPGHRFLRDLVAEVVANAIDKGKASAPKPQKRKAPRSLARPSA